MKCRKCGNKAVINMRQHRLALCNDHYTNWVIEHTDRFIKKYRMFNPNDRILVAISGGKDSLSLWDILWELGYHADGLYIGLGIDGGIGYSHQSQQLCEKFAGDRNLYLHVTNIPTVYSETIPEMAIRTNRGKDKPCSVCGLTKRHVMNRIARDEGYNVLVTGHNLDDEAAVLFGNTLQWQVGYLQRQSPVLNARDGLVRKAKPLCRFYEREMAAYAFLRGIEYIHDECPNAVGAKSIYYKELLNELETELPGAKLRFYLSFLQAKEQGLLAHPEEITTDSLGNPVRLNVCPSCGQPTSAPGECAFCRMVLQDNSRR